MILVMHGTAVIGVVRCSSAWSGTVRRGQARFGPVMLAHCQCASRIGKSFIRSCMARRGSAGFGLVMPGVDRSGAVRLDPRRIRKCPPKSGGVRHCWERLGVVMLGLEWNGRAVFGEVRHGTVVSGYQHGSHLEWLSK